MPEIPAFPPAPRSGQGISRWHNLLFVLGSAFVLLLLGSSYWQATASLRALGDLRQQAARVEHLDSLLIQLMDAENAVRGYLLSGNRAHLEPYEKTLITAQQTLEQIRQDLGPDNRNDDALADLSGLVAIKLRSLDQAAGRGIAGEEVRLQGKRYTDRIRDRILGLKDVLAAEAEDSFERSTSHVEQTRLVVGILAAGVLALLAFLSLVINRQFKLREQLAGLLQSENQRLDAVVQERTAELSDLASYLTNTREAEKARLARELHDELGALLTAAKMDLAWIGRKLDGSARELCAERLARLDDLLDQVIGLKRRIIDDLRPPLLEELGLVSTLRTLGEEFARGAGESFILELPEDDVDLPPASALAIFRIAQEALTNIRKHAHARQIRLALRVTADGLELEIADDGSGFHTGWVRGRHHGLAGMKHRALMCGGDCRVSSQPGGGTQIVVRLPLAAPDQPGTAWRT
ncbi:MAG: CHASE3 domain-containing protein [Bacteroidota bacterium]